MQHDHAGGIAMLLDDPDRYAFSLCTFSQAGQKLEPFARVPGERVRRRHRVKDVEPGPAHASDAERPVKGVTTCLREVDCAQDLLYRSHIISYCQDADR
jgi:hypothetical protein